MATKEETYVGEETIPMTEDEMLNATGMLLSQKEIPPLKRLYFQMQVPDLRLPEVLLSCLLLPKLRFSNLYPITHPLSPNYPCFQVMTQSLKVKSHILSGGLRFVA